LHGGENMVRRDKAVFQKGLDQDASHFAGSENGQSILQKMIRHKTSGNKDSNWEAQR
jgi:hypothetical protein